MSPAAVSAHAFLPLLGYTKVQRRMSYEEDRPLLALKPRDIRYASHFDSALYSLYAKKLSERYECALNTKGIDQSILAYRSGIGYSVNFAKSLFDEIRTTGNCTVICLDVRGFFDNLCHEILLDRCKKILDFQRLPEDWFKVLQRVTRYDYIDKAEIETLLGRSRGGRVCDIDTFRRKLRPLIKSNRTGRGIPQGTPISGLLANVYMIEIDFEIRRIVERCGGSYRRYSDDIAILVPSEHEETLRVALMCLNTMLLHHGLDLKESKTTVTHFCRQDAAISHSGDLLQYLGFTFDGRRTLIRSGSLRNFYARMKSNVRRYIRSAARQGIPAGELRRRVLVGRFSHWGDNRNFVQYAYRASREMSAPEIRRQLRNHVQILAQQWGEMVEKYYGSVAAEGE